MSGPASSPAPARLVGLVVCAQLVAFWPAIHWSLVRTRYDSDERWELLALALAAAFVLQRGWRARRADGLRLSARSLIGAAAAVAVYAGVQSELSPLARAAAAATILAASLSAWVVGRRAFLGLWGLLLLALPVLPVLQFQLGYPLRLASAWLAAPLLALGGLDVEVVGTCLRWSGELVWVDAPCSGVRMVWSGLLVVFAGACALDLDGRRSLQALALAVPSLVLANALRTAALFQLEVGLVSLPAWGHDGVGLVVQALVMAWVAFTLTRLEQRSCVPPCSI